MKKSLLLLFLGIILFLGCELAHVSSFPYAFDHEYTARSDNDILKSTWSNKITFFDDGSYKRSEFIMDRYVNEKNEMEYRSIYITQINGRWKMKAKKVELTDIDVVDYYCELSYLSSIVDCDYTLEELPFGTSEWFDETIILTIYEGELIIGNEGGNRE